MKTNSNNESELAKLAPATIYPINKSDKSVTVSGVDGNGTPVKINIVIPYSLQSHSLIRLYIGYLKSPVFLKQSPSTRYGKAIDIRHFITFIKSKPEFLNGSIPLDVINLFFIEQKKVSDKTSFYGQELNLKTPIKIVLKKNKDIDSKYYDSTLADYLAFCPNFPPPTSNPKKSLAELFGQKNCPYNDTELIQSLRLACCFLLNKFTEIRDDILSNKEIENYLSKLKTCKYQNVILLKNPQSLNLTTDAPPLKLINKSSWKKLKKINELIHQEVINLNDAYLTEWYTSGSFPTPKKDSEESKLTKIDWLIKFKGNNQITLSSNKYRLRRYDNVTPRFLIEPSDLESFLIQCLLASDSIQRSGISSHTLSDFSCYEESAQLEFRKNRRKKTSATPIYTRQSLPFECYTNFLKLRKTCSNANINTSNKTIHYYNLATGKGQIGYSTKPLKFFELLISNTSDIQKIYKKELGSEGDPFLWLINKIWRQNQLASSETPRISAQKRNGLDEPGYAKKKNKIIGLTPDPIAQSRKHMDDVSHIRPKTSKASNEEAVASEEVKAELTVHSSAVKQNIYKNRSNSKESIDSETNFGAQVGNLMVDEALKLGEQLSNIEFIDPTKLRELLGIKREFITNEEILEQVDIELWGGFKKNGQIMILVSDTTSMLLKGYINHISSELPKLFLDSERKGQEAQKKLAYLSEIFNNLPVHIQKQGENMLSEYDIPYPSLI